MKYNNKQKILNNKKNNNMKYLVYLKFFLFNKIISIYVNYNLNIIKQLIMDQNICNYLVHLFIGKYIKLKIKQKINILNNLLTLLHYNNMHIIY